MFKTYHPKEKAIKRTWQLVDVKDKILGRVATDIARLLVGKHKRQYAPNVDMGDWVVVVNASKVKVTGKKEEQKTYFRHSGYPGGDKIERLRDLRKKDPTKIIRFAVKNMLPDNRLKDDRLARLKIFAGEEHPFGDKLKTNNEKLKTTT